MGADGIELDVHRTADGHAVVHHDERVDPAGSIPAIDASNLPSHVPSLAEALDACGPLMVNVEVKNPSRLRHYDAEMVTVELVAQELLRRDLGQFSISSFDLPTVDAARARLPVETGFLVDRGDPTRLLRLTASHRHDAVHPADLLVDEVFMAQARQLGLIVNVWTVDDPGRIEELVRLGVDGIITNVPDVGRGVVDAVGADPQP